MKTALVESRGAVKVAGEDARKFLNGLVTADIGKVSTERARYAALLTPQGKIIVDFIIVEAGGGLLLDCPRTLAPALAERLLFYKLRAKVAIEDQSEQISVTAVWDGVFPAGGAQPETVCYADPRLTELGVRCIAPRAASPAAAFGAELADVSAYEAHRIALGVPSGGIDFAYGDAFPHEADMDQLNGIDFDKGCYVGQEVVSRMEHRGTARKRVVPLAFSAQEPAVGTEVTAGGRPMGTIGSVAAGRALAMVRLDRIEEALGAGAPLMAGGVQLKLAKPAWARFAFPGETTSTGETASRIGAS